MNFSFHRYTSSLGVCRFPLIIGCFLLLFVFSCNESPTGTADHESADGLTTARGDSEATRTNGMRQTQYCYLNTLKKDSVVLRFTINNNRVTGSLEYKHFEKDQNSGTIEGKMAGDTLIADYTFSSEGTVSVRQVAFLKKGNLLIEGYGEAEERAGKSVFRNTAELRFDEKMALNEVDCQ